MSKLNFAIDRYQIAYYSCLKNFGEDNGSQEWKELQKELVEKFSETAGFLFFQPKEIGWALNWFGYPNTNLNRFIRDQKMVLKIFEHIFSSSVFQKQFSEIEVYKQTLEKEWLALSEKIMDLFTGITGLKVEREVTVSVLHPSMEIGSYMGDDLIEWGTPDEYIGSQSVGLAHELLHVVTNELLESLQKQEDMWRLHALIYLSVDEELRTRLGLDNTKYFEGTFVKERHGKLIETAKKLMPVWEEYIKQNRRDILKLFEEIKS